VTKAVAYMRCSGLGQGTDTWERQLEAIRTFCTAEGFELVRVYQEDAVPGKLDREDRPAFKQMIADLAENGCKTIIVERLDRLARRFGTQESLLTYLVGEGLTLYAADSGENVTEAMMGDPMRRALVQIQGIFAELDKNMTIAKLRKARQRLRQANGKCEGRMAYGTKTEETSILEHILDAHRLGNNAELIAKKLNAYGYKSRYGKPWQGATVRKILNRHETCARLATNSAQPKD
jgi:DNA invertase Pin-like site-specific DNA recombinase